jgi:hypothetical protein
MMGVRNGTQLNGSRERSLRHIFRIETATGRLL